MQVIQANEEFPTGTCRDVSKVLEYYEENSMFLAGPTPRSADVESWRGEALRILEEDLDFGGKVFVPESDTWSHSYVDQVEWEEAGLRLCGCIVFWIPRDLETLPGFTTNVEWGTWCDSGKVVLGYPPNTPKMKYIRYYAERHLVQVTDTLKGTLENAIRLLNGLL